MIKKCLKCGVINETKYCEKCRTQKCKECGLAFTVKIFTQNSKLFCSKSCSNRFNTRKRAEDPAWRIKMVENGKKSSSKGKNAGKYHHNWKGGITPFDKSERVRFRREMQPKIFKRDDYTCQICDCVGGDLSVDHIKSWSKYPELRFDEKNCRTLCMDCHYFVTFGRKKPSGLIWGHNLCRCYS